MGYSWRSGARPVSFGASAPPTVLEAAALELTVEHLTTHLQALGGPGYGVTVPLPKSKPALPQITWTDTPTFSQYTKFCIVRVYGIVAPIDWTGAPYYAEVVVDGTSLGVKTFLKGSRFGAVHFGDIDPLVPHLVQVYLWTDVDMQLDPKYPASFSISLRIGTVSVDETVTVWEKPMLFPSYFAFSDWGIYDLEHIYVDGLRVKDYALWWSGSKLMFRGTNFSLTGDLIYQRVFIADAVVDPIKEEIVIESPHPYPPSYDNTWTITRTGAKRIRVHFTKVVIEDRDDNLYLNNEDGDTIHDYSGYDITDIWSPWVFGDTIKLRLTSDAWNEFYGFHIDKIEWVGG